MRPLKPNAAYEVVRKWIPKKDSPRVSATRDAECCGGFHATENLERHFRTIPRKKIAMLKTCLIVNTQSGGWNRWKRDLEGFAKASDVPVLREDQQRPLAEVLERVRREKFQRLILAGGDGTLSRVVNQAMPSSADFEWGLIPTGTGNDLARSIGILGEPMEDVWEWMLTRPASTIDAIQVSNGKSQFVLNAVTGGFGGIVSTDVSSEDKRRLGSIAYWYTAFSRLAALEEFHVRLEMDSDTLELKTNGLAIANGRYVGGGFPVAPNASLVDGMLDVVTVPALPTLELLAAGVDYTLGRQHHPERVQAYRSSRVNVHAEPELPYSLDGEPTQSIDATFEIVPHFLPLVCGPDAPAMKVAKAASSDRSAETSDESDDVGQ